MRRPGSERRPSDPFGDFVRTVRMSHDLYEHSNILASERGWSFSELVRFLLYREWARRQGAGGVSQLPEAPQGLEVTWQA